MLNERDLIVTLPFNEDQRKRQEWLKIQRKDDKITKVMNELYETEAVFTRDMRLYSCILSDLIKDKKYSRKDRLMLTEQKEAIDNMLYQKEKVGFFELLSKPHDVKDLTELITNKSKENTVAYFDNLGQLSIIQTQMHTFTKKLKDKSLATFLNENAIKPIQRGPRYVLLAKEMEGNAERTPLTSFFQGLMTKVNALEETKISQDNIKSGPTKNISISSQIIKKTTDFKHRLQQIMHPKKQAKEEEIVVEQKNPIRPK